MINYFILHTKYFFNKRNVLLLIILFVFFILFLLFNISPFVSINDKWFDKNVYNDGYFLNSMIIIKIIVITLSCFLSSSCYLQNNDNYYLLVITNKKDRISYFITKQLSIYFWLIIIIINLLGIYMLVGFLAIPLFINKMMIVNIIIPFLIISFLYSNLAVFMMLIIKNGFVAILLFLIYFITEALIDFDYQNIIYIIELIFPHIIIKNYSLNFFFGYPYLFFISFIFFISNVILYKYLDL